MTERGVGGPTPLSSQLRSVPPVALATLSTIFAATASMSLSVSVLSRGCSRAVIATDFLPAPICASALSPANWSNTRTLSISALSAPAAALTSVSASTSGATTKAKRGYTRETVKLTKAHVTRAERLLLDGKVPGRGMEWGDTEERGLTLRLTPQALTWYLRTRTDTVKLGAYHLLDVTQARFAAEKAKVGLRQGDNMKFEMSVFHNIMARTGGDLEVVGDVAFPDRSEPPPVRGSDGSVACSVSASTRARAWARYVSGTGQSALVCPPTLRLPGSGNTRASCAMSCTTSWSTSRWASSSDARNDARSTSSWCGLTSTGRGSARCTT